MIKINVEYGKKRQEIKAFVVENGGKVLQEEDNKIMYVDFIGVPLGKKMHLIEQLNKI